MIGLMVPVRVCPSSSVKPVSQISSLISLVLDIPASIRRSSKRSKVRPDRTTRLRCCRLLREAAARRDLRLGDFTVAKNRSNIIIGSIERKHSGKHKDNTHASSAGRIRARDTQANSMVTSMSYHRHLHHTHVSKKSELLCPSSDLPAATGQTRPRPSSRTGQ